MTGAVARRLAWLVLAAALLVALVGAPTAASSTDDEPADTDQFVSIEFDVVGGVPWNAAIRVPAQVTVEASRAVSGTLTVLDQPEGGTSTTWEFDLDLAAGSRVEFPVILTTGWNGVNAFATVRSGSSVVGSEDVRLNGTGQDVDRHVAIYGVDDPPRRINEQATDYQL
ncbi:MAG: hypothetical protein AAFO29_00240, partial [Actinomycetota bacterium]